MPRLLHHISVRYRFPLHSRWTSEKYLRFLRQNGWAVQKSAVLKASFPLTYAECTKSKGPDVVL